MSGRTCLPHSISQPFGRSGCAGVRTVVERATSTSSATPSARHPDLARHHAQHVAGYLAKYATKATEPAGHLSSRLSELTVRLYSDPAKHTGRLVAAAWNLGRHEAGSDWSRLRPWAHMLGFGGHFATKSRAYSTTFGALRAARSAAMRRANANASPDEEPETVLVVGSWTYAGTGWRTTADAALALAAADAARQRRPAAADPAA